jgi:type IV secretory pathway VirB4 component
MGPAFTKVDVVEFKQGPATRAAIMLYLTIRTNNSLDNQ